MARLDDVAIFSSSYHPNVGGVEEAVRQLARRLVAEGTRPAVFTMRWPKTLGASEIREGVPIHRYVFRVAERRPRQALGALATRRHLLNQMTAQVQILGSSLVHVQCVSANAWYAERVARRSGLPLVVTLQGELSMDASQVYERSTVLPPLLRRLLHHADAVTACSRATLEEAAEFAEVDLGSRGTVVYNGVSIEEFNVPPHVSSRPYVFAIGRLVRQKGFDVLLRGFARASLPDHDLLLAGDGVERVALERLAGDLGIADRVSFLGSVDRLQVSRLFRGASCFVLPSRHEPMGIVNLEAMAAGTPLIATAVGGVPELVRDGIDGVLIPPDDEVALSTTIRRAIGLPDEARALASNAMNAVRRFEWAAITQQYLEVYERARATASRGRG